jgi:hypothetical protein
MSNDPEIDSIIERRKAQLEAELRGLMELNEERVQRLLAMGRQPNMVDVIGARIAAMATVLGLDGNPLLELTFQQHLSDILMAEEAELERPKLFHPDGTPIPSVPLPFDDPA